MTDDDPTATWLCTLSQARRSIFGKDNGPSPADDDISDYIASATPIVEDVVGPVYQRTGAVSRDGGKPAVSTPWPFRSVVEVTESGTVTTDYTPDESAGILYAGTDDALRRWRPGHANIRIACQIGMDATPPNVVSATRALVRFWYQQERQGGRPAYGDQSVDMVQTPQGFAMPRRVLQLLRPNEEDWGFA